MKTKTPKIVVPPPTPLAYSASRETLGKEIEFFLSNTPETRRLKRNVVRSLENGWVVWTGSARYELGLQFVEQPVALVHELLFARAKRDKPNRLGRQSLAYLEAELKKVGLRIGQAIPPNDYD